PGALPLRAGVTLLPLLALLAQALLRRPPAATRHLVWHLALVGSLVIATSVAFIPGVPLRVGILPSGLAAPSSGADLASEASAPPTESSIDPDAARASRSVVAADTRAAQRPFDVRGLPGFRRR